MTWKKLVEKGDLQKKPISSKEIDGILSKARKCLSASEILLKEKIHEPAFKEAYDAMLLASRALMFSLGYKPRTVGAHTITINFCELYFGKETKLIIEKFKRMKQKRNYLIYGAGLMVSMTETKNSIKSAKDWIDIIEEEILKHRGQKRLL